MGQGSASVRKTMWDRGGRLCKEDDVGPAEWSAYKVYRMA